MILAESVTQGAVAIATFAQAGAFPDTVVAIEHASGLDRWADILGDVAKIILAIALILIAVAALVAAMALRNLHRKLLPVLDRFRGDVDPIVKHATAVADNVNYVSTAVRGDVERLQRAIESANQRVNRATAVAEQRVNELNALLQVVQEEAEELFIGTASSLRGVRASADALRRMRDEPLDEMDDGYGLDEPGARPDLAPRRP